MSPIHEGISIGLKIAALHRHARKVKKHLIVEKRLSITVVVDSIIDKLSELEKEGMNLKKKEPYSHEETYWHQ